MLEAYREHVAERASQNIPPKPLSAEQVAALVELLKNPPAGEEDSLVDLISNRVPPGVDGRYCSPGGKPPSTLPALRLRSSVRGRALVS